jgi:hypothetical protein
VAGRVGVSGLIVSLLGGLGISGCGGSGENVRPQENVAEATVEYHREEAHLQLAPGSQWTTNPERSSGPGGKPQYYRPGAATADADIYWWCTWATYVLTGAGAPVSLSAAVGELGSVFDTYFYQHALAAGDRPWFRSVVTDAERRDYGPLRNFASANCEAARSAGRPRNT